jgi:hypothetical protein
VGDYMEGIFYLEDPNQDGVIYLDVTPEKVRSGDLITPITNINNVEPSDWEERIIDDLIVKVSKPMPQ